jgi:hypothetical protein
LVLLALVEPCLSITISKRNQTLGFFVFNYQPFATVPMKPLYFTLVFGLILSLSSLSQVNPSLKEEIKLYPNPVSEGFIYVNFGRWGHGSEHVEIYDITGNKVVEAIVNTGAKNNHRLDLSTLSYGHYFILVKSKNEIYSARITVN